MGAFKIKADGLSTIHKGDTVRFLLPSGQEEVVTLREYQYEVLDFAKSVKGFDDIL